MSRQGVHGWLKMPAQQEAGRKAAATRGRREAAINSAAREWEKVHGVVPTGAWLREIIERVVAEDKERHG